MSQLILTGITWDHPRGHDPLVAASRRYLQDFGLEVRWEKRSLKDFGEQAVSELAKEFDLLIVDHPHMGMAASTESLQPLDGLISSIELDALSGQFAGPSYASYTYHSHQWALPVDASVQASCYRQDLLRSSIPSTWEDVFELASGLRSHGKWVGKALCPTDAMCTFLTLLAQLGSPFDEGSESFVDRATGLEALMILLRMKDELHPRCLEWNPIQLYDHMTATDEVVYSPLDFIYSNYSRDSFRTRRLTCSHAAGKVGLLGGAGLAISSNCAHPSEAAEYARWICGTDVQRDLYVCHQGQPASSGAWTDPASNELTHDFFGNTLETLTNAYVRPRFPGWPGFQDHLGKEIHAFLRTGIDPEKTLKKIQRSFEAAI